MINSSNWDQRARRDSHPCPYELPRIRVGVPPEWSWSKQILLPIESSVEPIVKLEFRFFNDEVLPVGALGSQRAVRAAIWADSG